MPIPPKEDVPGEHLAQEEAPIVENSPGPQGLQLVAPVLGCAEPGWQAVHSDVPDDTL